MGELVHVSKVKVYKEPGKGKVKKAYIEGFPEPIRMGVHGGIKKFFGGGVRGGFAGHPGLFGGRRWQLFDGHACGCAGSAFDS